MLTFSCLEQWTTLKYWSMFYKKISNSLVFIKPLKGFRSESLIFDETIFTKEVEELCIALFTTITSSSRFWILTFKVSVRVAMFAIIWTCFHSVLAMNFYKVWVNWPTLLLIQSTWSMMFATSSLWGASRKFLVCAFHAKLQLHHRLPWFSKPDSDTICHSI